jgi:tetratricopeptide (TPR) repeat protein
VGCAAIVLAFFLAAFPAAAEVYSWVDADGVTHLTDDPAAVPPAHRAQEGRRALDGLWDDPRGPLGAESARPAPRNSEEARQRRVLQGAVEDLGRGETARAFAALMSILRIDPGNPEAHWYLALLDRQRGRYDAAQAHLEAFLAAAGEDLEPWRASAERRLEELADERRLSDGSTLHTSGSWLGLSSDHFRVYYDPALGEASPSYARTVMRYLEEARASVSQRLGAVPHEAMGVVFYGKAAYLEAHRHRFSFQTVGFFDGRIHVVSAGHPAGELRSLLFHEYAHAVFREQTGGDRPYWLNEGLAEISERASLGRRGLTRSERQALRRRIVADSWIPLSRIAPSFSGLGDGDARAAYLESLAAAAWIEAHSDPAGRSRLLAHLGEGSSDDQALSQALGLTTGAVDAALRREILDEFPLLDRGIATRENDAPASAVEAPEDPENPGQR